MCIEEYIISVYCIPDDLVKKYPEKLGKRGGRTRLTDADVIAMEVVGEFPGLHCDIGYTSVSEHAGPSGSPGWAPAPRSRGRWPASGG